MINDVPEVAEQVNNILQLGAEHKRSLLSDIDQMRTVDGYEHWRQRESNELSNLVQKRLHYLQNPGDCKTARKLVCKLNKVSAVQRYRFSAHNNLFHLGRIITLFTFLISAVKSGVKSRVCFCILLISKNVC